MCLDYVDLGFDDIMKEGRADHGHTLSEDHHMSVAETEECQGETEGEGDIISDIERIQRALTGDNWSNVMAKQDDVKLEP